MFSSALLLHYIAPACVSSRREIRIRYFRLFIIVIITVHAYRQYARRVSLIATDRPTGLSIVFCCSTFINIENARKRIKSSYQSVQCRSTDDCGVYIQILCVRVYKYTFNNCRTLNGTSSHTPTDVNESLIFAIRYVRFKRTRIEQFARRLLSYFSRLLFVDRWVCLYLPYRRIIR